MTQDRRRTFDIDDKIRRITISLPESLYLKLMRKNADSNLSSYIRKLIEKDL